MPLMAGPDQILSFDLCARPICILGHVFCLSQQNDYDLGEVFADYMHTIVDNIIERRIAYYEPIDFLAIFMVRL